MVGAEQVFAYAHADFTETDQSVVDHLSALLQSAHVELLSGDLILDLGCGPGNISERLADRWSSANVVGVDGAAAMISIANDQQDAQKYFQDHIPNPKSNHQKEAPHEQPAAAHSNDRQNSDQW